MNQVRVFLLFAWLLVAFLLWEAWQQEQAASAAQTLPAATTGIETSSPGQDMPVGGSAVDPTLPSADVAASAESSAATGIAGGNEAVPSSRRITITTDVLRLEVDEQGVSIVGAELLAYRTRAEAGAPPVRLLDAQPGMMYVAQSGWHSSATAAPNHRARFEGPQHDVQLAAGENSLAVPFVWVGPDGVSIERVLHLQRGSYAIGIEDRVVNQGTTEWRASPYYQLQREPPVQQRSGFTNPEAYSFVGAAWYSDSEKYNKIAFGDFDPREPLNVSAQHAWIGMLQHYFFTAWVPPGDETLKLDTAVVESRRLIRAVAPAVTVAPGAQQERTVSLFVGPKLQDQMAALAPGLELAVDFGKLTFIAEPLHWLLSKFHALTGNWGWAIILLVLLIKALFFKLSEAQYRSFARMRQIQPRIEALKERYGDDRQKFNMAMMELYKKEKINPVGGCLPIFLQLPVFFALYWVLLESVELRHAPFALWIQNLTAPDPYFVLPVLNLAVMWLTQKLQPAVGMDPMQRKMLQFMPLVFGVLFAFFPAGLVLYWTVNGGLGLLQQWLITRRFAAHTAKA